MLAAGRYQRNKYFKYLIITDGAFKPQTVNGTEAWLLTMVLDAPQTLRLPRRVLKVETATSGSLFCEL